MKYANRADAGRRLAAALVMEDAHDLLILALPRGGLPVAWEIARALRAPLDVLVVRKLGVPGYEELAMGAIASGGAMVQDKALMQSLGIGPAAVARVLATERAELARREWAYRGNRPFPVLTARKLMLVDDGLATGASMRAAVASVRSAAPRRVMVAAPVGSREACATLRRLADAVICPLQPEPFHGVGQWYADFRQVEDLEVRQILAHARLAQPA